MDGGSDDGTWEWLNKYKDVYNLELYQHPYDDQGAQRNRLLSHIPKDSWLINIDQDEQISCPGFYEFVENVDPSLLIGNGRDLPLTIRIPNINLVENILHFDDNKMMFFATKVFYNDRNVHFTPGYHMSICYFETETNTNAIPAPENWVIKHYAYLNTDRLLPDKKRHYTQEERDPSKWLITSLPDKWK